jgi:hypothetical protein
MKRRSSSRLTLERFLPLLSLLCSVLLFGLQFFVGGGRTKLINDSHAYLLMTQGERVVGAPFSSRVLAPFIASLIAFASGASSLAAFQILTLAAFIGSLVLLRKIIGNQGGSAVWQAAVLLVFGCALAVTFGYTPVMVDPVLLLLACLTILALNRGYWVAAVVLSALAALTKEYGLLLGIVSSLVAWHRGHRRFACVAALLPVIVLSVAMLIGSGFKGTGLDGWHNFLNAMFGYHTYLFQFRGPSEYPKLLYMWSWSALWPVLVIAAGLVLSRLRNRIRMSDHEVGFSVMLAALPLLLLGDWGRALLIVVPFGCAVATSHPLARNAQFAALLAIGGLATALARPFHSELAPPLALTLTMTVISITSSLLIGVKILRFAPSDSSPQLDPGLDNPAPEVAAQ